MFFFFFLKILNVLTLLWCVFVCVFPPPFINFSTKNLVSIFNYKTFSKRSLDLVGRLGGYFSISTVVFLISGKNRRKNETIMVSLFSIFVVVRLKRVVGTWNLHRILKLALFRLARFSKQSGHFFYLFIWVWCFRIFAVFIWFYHVDKIVNNR